MRNWLNWGARKKMMVVRGWRWLCFFFFSEKTSAKLKGWNVMIESYNAWIVFKCCESIKETKLTVDIWTAENPPAWNDFCFRKASPARTAFDLQSDEGYVSKGQLLWMLADSGMPVNKAGWRLLRCKKKSLVVGLRLSNGTYTYTYLFPWWFCWNIPLAKIWINSAIRKHDKNIVSAKWNICFIFFSGCQDGERDSEKKKTTKKQKLINDTISRLEIAGVVGRPLRF